MTFLYFLEKIRQILGRETVNEDPNSPEQRLAVRLYRLGLAGEIISMQYTKWLALEHQQSPQYFQRSHRLLWIVSAIRKSTDPCHTPKLNYAWKCMKGKRHGSSHVVGQPLLGGISLQSVQLVDYLPLRNTITSKTFIPSFWWQKWIPTVDLFRAAVDETHKTHYFSINCFVDKYHAR